MAVSVEQMMASDGYKILKRVLEHRIKEQTSLLSQLPGGTAEEIGMMYIEARAILNGLEQVEQIEQKMLNDLKAGIIPWLNEVFTDKMGDE